MFMAIASVSYWRNICSLEAPAPLLVHSSARQCLVFLKDGFTLSGVSAYTFSIILGGAILITMLINVHLSRLRAAGGG